MQGNNLCYGCMKEKGEAKVCPKCGWVEGTEAESPLHLKPGTILSGKYLVGRVLGHGGFGITYLACDINLGAKLAIKEYFPQGMATRSFGDPTISVYSGNTKEHFQYGLDKFLEEARTLVKFDDISEIVTVKDFFKENNTAYLVMSYVEGITLKQYVEQKGGRIPLDMVLNIMLPVMRALEEVHKEGILHRDISPDNIYMTKNFNVKLLDFGAARFAMGEYSKSLSVILKPGYAPEEQYRTRGNQGPWTDVYAVAATMYRALTGETPPDALDRLFNDDIKPPSELRVEISRNIESAIMKAMAIKASDRYQSIKEFSEEFFKEIPADVPEIPATKVKVDEVKLAASVEAEKVVNIAEEAKVVNAVEEVMAVNLRETAKEEVKPIKQTSAKNDTKPDAFARFDFVSNFSEGLAYVRQGDRYGFVDEKGKVAISVEYDDARSFSHGQAYVRKGKREFYVDRYGKEINLYGSSSESTQKIWLYTLIAAPIMYFLGLKFLGIILLIAAGILYMATTYDM